PNFPTQAPIQGTGGGGSDTTVTEFLLLPPPVFTAISPDTGASSSDQITTSQQLTLSGTATPSSTVSVSRARTRAACTTTASSSGNWSFDYSAATLPEGTSAFTAAATTADGGSPESEPFLVTVDLTPPAVTLAAPASTLDPSPQVTVTATDAGGLPPSATVTLDVDLNNDGTFSGTAETGSMPAPLAVGLAVFNVSPALPLSTVRLRARVTDLAGNEGTSAAATVTVGSFSSPVVTVAAPALTAINPDTGVSAADQLTSARNLTLSGTAPASSTVTLYRTDTRQVAPAPANRPRHPTPHPPPPPPPP